MSDKRPTPYKLTVCLAGITHTFSFRGNVRARAAYAKLAGAANEAIRWQDLMSWAPDTASYTPEQVAKARDAIGRAPALVEVEDDFGSYASIDPRKVMSFQLLSVADEHRANFDLKLSEVYAALEFDAMVKEEHPGALAQLRAMQASGKLIQR